MTVTSQTIKLAVKVFAKSAPLLVMLAIVFTLESVAHADALVTLCQTADDSGSGMNLRNALLAQPDPNSLINTITFQCGGSATIQVSGPLEIFQATRIDGGNAITLVSNNPSTHTSLVVVANPGHFLYLNNLTLRHPNTNPTNCTAWLANGCPGGVVNGQGVTELRNVFIDSSHIPVSVTSGTLNIFNSQFTGNSEAVVVAAPGAVTTTIDHSVFQNNPSAPPIEATGSVTITNSQFTNSGASNLQGACQLTIDRSTFQNNAPNGALSVNCNSTISHSSFTNNASDAGGAIRFFAGATHIMLRADQFVNNSATQLDGAVYFDPQANMTRTLAVRYSVFKGNKAVVGGGAIRVGPSFDFSGRTLITSTVTTFSRNSAGTGGAILAQQVELFTARTVFADNSATGNGGAVDLSNLSAPFHSIFANTLFVRNSGASGSAFYGDAADFINSTVDSNKGLAISNAAPHPPAHNKFSNSIISNNPQGGCGPAGLFDDAGHNLQFPGTDCGASISVANPHLDTMYIPIPKSPPIGNGNLTVCMSPPISGRDVYGVGRPSGGVCTIGAAEGDIEVLLHKHGGKGRPGQCDCGTSLLKQLQRYFSFVR